MSKAAASIFIFAIYLTVLGVILIVAPNFLLSIFGIASTSEVWVRIVGMLCLFLAFYYYQAVRHRAEDFFRWTLYPRAFLIVFLTAFVLLGFVNPPIILFGVVDMIGVIWTALALRN